MAQEAHELSAAELSTAFAERDLSPVEVVEACLMRIEAPASGNVQASRAI